MDHEPKGRAGLTNWVKDASAVVGAIVVIATLTGGALNRIGVRTDAVGASVSNAALVVFGDPCDGDFHPAYNTDERSSIVDGVQRYEGADSNVLWMVEKAAEKGNWAYIETVPPTGSTDQQLPAYVLHHDADDWAVKWEGDAGARPGDPDYPQTGNPDYPNGFDSWDQNVLRCKSPAQ
jgi:hypothetical protein